jgi:hypothetical protein
MSKRRGHGDGGIDPRGPDTWRLRYRISGKRFSITFHGSLSDARKESRRLIRTSRETETHGQIDASAALARPTARWSAAARLPVLLCRP